MIQVLLLLIVVSLSSSSSTPTNFEQFGHKLYSTVCQNKVNENIFLSPVSISLAMSMCTVGARQDTLNQMLQTFQASSTKQLVQTAQQVMHVFSFANQTQDIQLKLANRLYAQKEYELQQDFLQTIQNSFKADMKLEDFENNTAQAIKSVNTWVEQQTNNLIRNLLSTDDVTSDTRLILVNCIYFKGTWKMKFDESLTDQNADFHGANGAISKVTLMEQTEDYAYAENNDLHAQIVHIPYKSENEGGGFVFTVILPDRGVQLDVVEQKLASKPDLMQQLLSETNTTMEKLHLHLPKFKMQAKFVLNDILQQLGIRDAFNEDKANFMGISNSSGQRRLYISKVIHKAFIDVNEQGSEAAASTGVVINRQKSSPPRSSIEFKADRPFLFFIQESRQNLVLFSGRFISPPTNS